MINLKPQIKDQKWDIFTLWAWLDTVNNPLFLWNWKVTVAKNIEFTDIWWIKRDWLTLWGQTGSTVVNWIGVIKREAWDIFMRVYWTKLQKLVTTTWTDVAGVTLTNIKASIVSYEATDMTSAASKTWTWAATSTSRTFVPWVWWMTINAYAWKVLMITSGTGSGQEKLITSNDLTTLYIEWTFETTPDATSVYDIRSLVPHVIITNGTDSVIKYDWTTVTTLSTMPKWNTLEVAHDRLWGAREDLDFVYFSNLATIYFPDDNYIPIDPSWDIITKIQKNKEEIIVYKENSRWRIVWYSPDTFQLLNADSRIWAIAPNSVVHWNNFNFFLWFWGIYSVNSLDNSTIDEGLPISVNINDSILAHTSSDLVNATGWVYDNKYFCSVWTDVYVYDIEQSQLKQTHVWSIFNYEESISSALVTWWIAYVWSATKTYYISGTSDNGTEITCQVDSDRRSQWDVDAYKIYGVTYINFKKQASTCNVSVYYSIEWWSYTLLKTQDVSTEWQIRVNISKRWRDIKFKYTYGWTLAPEMIKQELFYTTLTKAI
jgi:hypothetical protein